MTELFASVIIDISHEKVDRPFQYRIPEKFRKQLQVGMQVEVPFGKGNHLRTGYVMELSHHPLFPVDKIKEIKSLPQSTVSAEGNQIRLAWWMKKHYGSTMITALKTVLPVKEKTKSLQERQVSLRLSCKEGIGLLDECKRKHQTARARALEALLQAPGQVISYEYLTREERVSGVVLKALEEKGIIQILEHSIYRDPLRSFRDHPELEPEPTQDAPVVLSREQRRITEDILGDYRDHRPGTYLIHGITGSGKTEVYMELISGMIAMGKQIIMLIPEIALTYQTVNRFVKRFGERVSILHSRLSAGERYDQCERARRGEIDVMIGPRSALFTPFPSLGMVIMDEEHESSYKSEQIPKYHARETAITLASYYGASVVLGSATPSVETYAKAKAGEYRLFTLTERLTGGTLPTVEVVDLREELRQGNRSVFSKRLQELIQDRLEKKEQIMLFLNRRGYAGFVSCRSCGHVMKCPHCDISLSQHGRKQLLCHYCGYEQPFVTRCPACGSPYIMGFRAGTEQIEEHVKRMFPAARVLRMDGDTTRKKDSYERILSAFDRHQADVLIGTQMIIKGHDFPEVTLMGILAADLSLHGADFRCGERTFQLLTQAAGRAGRGKRPGEVVIQTYQPDHPDIRFAAAQDYLGFFQSEMSYRGIMGYPPVGHMTAVLVTSKREAAATALAGLLAELARKTGEKVRILGPTSAQISRISDWYRVVFYCKSKDLDPLIHIKDVLETYLEKQGTDTERVQFDFDPMAGY